METFGLLNITLSGDTGKLQACQFQQKSFQYSSLVVRSGSCRSGSGKRNPGRVAEEHLARLLPEPGHQPVVVSGGNSASVAVDVASAGQPHFRPLNGGWRVALADLSQTNDEAWQCEENVLKGMT